jgi:hypothetical protein
MPGVGTRQFASYVASSSRYACKKSTDAGEHMFTTSNNNSSYLFNCDSVTQPLECIQLAANALLPC